MANKQYCVFCGTQLIEVPVFNSIDLICPHCFPDKIPDSKKNEDWIKDKLGYKKDKPKNAPPNIPPDWPWDGPNFPPGILGI